jgi:GNAT superfamily N-acetyltransferase
MAGVFMIFVRKMHPSEAREVRKLASKAFQGMEQFFISNPKEALVAEMDGKIVGGVMIKYIETAAHKVGYYDFVFTHPQYQGKGIGKALINKATEYLWEQGCTAVCAAVKDDNVGSWQLFINNGVQRVSLMETVRRLGLLTALKIYFFTPFFASNGMELYLAVKEDEVAPKSHGTGMQILLYLLANALLLLSGFRTRSNFFVFLAAVLTLLLGAIAAGYIGTLLTKEKWHYRLNSGGAFICAVIGFIGGVFPMIGNWYPPRFEKTDGFKRDMGIVALCEWIFMIIATLAGVLMQEQYTFFSAIALVGVVFLIYKAIPFYPFESYGGRRVLDWNRGLYALMTVISCVILAYQFTLN